MTKLPSGIAKDELDDEVRPQDDLFRHVNGKWIERTAVSYTHLTLPTN